ncbi:Phytanoyl-CoA dioxygenase (PhyH) [Actinopolymorpha cephalotaxi]|uniref:Ectoine hydroxylase-related dioxygenase (Phytanoyl-CoA dioxygenase family) n=1 Tax=Actinopolymorpha cephalotaxi TaxID=504797 RepID=A0A1I3BCV4_9ACTN|nr:phytanoyl-CoA dioxygenase family protein [Actinopolymorpha cephalotaxi]NYH86752.1 ectoine hydroxylase-related dioxygenase (phytanoyl-CoA dioxygenase family) [Actinopolymorpha cephalotaxi]SFH60137.1 Phytanoyl-CoA dioxygenase (PhyH) [Actinopolymorpha cephalotaxi]
MVDRLIGPATTAALRTAYDDLLARQDANPSDRMLGGITCQVMRPAQAHPLFDRNPAVDNALVVAQQLIGTDQLVRTFDMLIYKPPGHPHVTPWHQDYAYGAMPFVDTGTQMHDRSIQFWVPLDDVDTQTGCMQFIPGRHQGPLLQHYVASGSSEDEGRLLALTDPTAQLDLSRVVVAEIPSGGCTMHAPGTPHFTGANHSADRPRRSYIFNIGVRSAE